MTVSCNVSGLRGIADRRARATAELHTRAVAVIAKGAHDVEQLAQQLAPERTGDLSKSIGIVFVFDGLGAVIGAASPRLHIPGVTPVGYDGYVEYGTEDAPVEAYMGPAAKAVVPGVNAELADLARRAAK